MRGFGQQFFLVFVIAVSPLLTAQVDSEKKVFRVLGYGDGTFQGIFFEREGLEGETENVDLTFTPDRKSRPYQVSADRNRVVFYREEDSGQKSKRRIEVGRFNWAAGSSAATVLFLEPEEMGETRTYEILFIDESPEEWGAGDFRFLNLSGAPLDARLGDQRLALEQGLSRIYTVAGEATEPIRLSLFVDWEGERLMVYSIRTLPDAKFGKLLVVKPPLELGSLRVQVVNLW